jgi:hypothetical protein
MAVNEPFPWYTRLLLSDSEEFQRVRSERAAEHLSSLSSSLKTKGLELTTKVATGRPPGAGSW